MAKRKKSCRKQSAKKIEKILLATAMLNLIKSIVDLINELT